MNNENKKTEKKKSKTKEDKTKEQKCELCNFTTNKKAAWKKHEESAKHIRNMKNNENDTIRPTESSDIPQNILRPSNQELDPMRDDRRSGRSGDDTQTDKSLDALQPGSFGPEMLANENVVFDKDFKEIIFKINNHLYNEVFRLTNDNDKLKETLDILQHNVKQIIKSSIIHFVNIHSQLFGSSELCLTEDDLESIDNPSDNEETNTTNK
jgi:Zinc-finger of C2H2 type